MHLAAELVTPMLLTLELALLDAMELRDEKLLLLLWEQGV